MIDNTNKKKLHYVYNLLIIILINFKDFASTYIKVTY